MPIRARARVDLPEALGPMMPTTWPAGTEKLIPLIIGVLPPGALTIRFSTNTWPSGAGKDMRSGSDCCLSRISFKRAYCERALMNPFQLPMIKSSGASARPSKTEPAITKPPLISWLTARYAPKPKISDCTNMRKVLEMLDIKPPLSLAIDCRVKTFF